MDSHTMYTRVYSKSSAGRFVSAKAPKGDPLSDAALCQEFLNHARKWNREPTALVSASDRIVDTLKRAFDKHYDDGESSADIWVAFIEVPLTITETTTRIHSVKELAENCGHPEPNLFSHEVVFEYAIPDEYVLHEVSLQTLIKRGLRRHWFSQPSTAEARRRIARVFQRHGPWDIGVMLGCFARTFGARAPTNWISHQLFHDCVRAKIEDDDVVGLSYAHGRTETVDFQYFCDLDDGIDTSLYEWWLSDIDFYLHYQEFEEWRDEMEESMMEDLGELWKTWHDVDRDGTIKEHSAEEKLAYDEEYNKLLVKHEKKRAAIEVEAVRIGL